MNYKNVLLLIITFVFCLIILEVSLRIFMPQTLNIYQYNKDYVFEFRPNAQLFYERGEFSQQIKMNIFGFRDVERNYSKSNNTYRIAMLGDSFVSAFEVAEENRTSELLEKNLNSFKTSSEKKFEVFNFGVNGYSTEQELLQLEKKVINYNPDLVILNYYVGNDQIDNYNRKLFNFADGRLSVNEDREFSQRWPRSIFYFFTGKSHLVSFTFNNYQRIVSSYNPSDMRKEVGALSGKEFVETSLLKEKTDRSKEVWLKTQELLLNMSKFVKTNEKKFLVVLIPDRVQENEKDLKYLLNAHNITSEIESSKPQRILADFFAKENISYIDLLPELVNKTSQIHYLEDFHWNEKGHKIVSDVILQKLINDSIISISK